MNRQELGAFLRNRRERIAPRDVGLPSGQRRRTPGLRRDEVAQLAFISADYYARLEQGRAPQPSRRVLTGLVRALRLDDGERDYLHRLVGVGPVRSPGPPTDVRASIRDLLHRLPDAAAIAVSATYEVIAWNELACSLLEDFGALAPPGPQSRQEGFSRAARAGSTHLRSVRAREVRPNVCHAVACRGRQVPR